MLIRNAIQYVPGTPVPAVPITTMPPGVTAAVHLHPSYSTVVEAGGRVVTASDLKGLAPASEGEPGLGPLVMTDELGRKFWRFQGDEYLKNVADLVADCRGIAVYMVVRMHRNMSAAIFAQSTSAAPINTGGGVINTSVSGGALAPIIRGQTTSASSLADKHRYLLGAQLQLVGVASRPSANGGQRLHVNEASANVAQGGTGTLAVAGYEIARNPVGQAPPLRAMIDLYECIVVTNIVADANSDAVAANAVSAWEIPATTDYALLEGDSITLGVGTVLSGDCPAMALTNPGSPNALPANWRVINMGSSGALISTMVARRDGANSPFDSGYLHPTGRNIVVLQAGINDLNVVDGPTTYSRLIPLISTPTTGYLQRGWSVALAINIASTAGRLANLTAYRALLRDPQFLVDLDAASGGTYDGKVTRIELPMVTLAPSGTVFDTGADSADLTYYQSDALHPNTLGTATMARGGDTPQYGYSSIAA